MSNVNTTANFTKRTSAIQKELFSRVTAFLNQHFYMPDTKALDIVISQCISHYCFNDPPIWTFQQGASSSGKTSIIIKGVSFLPNTIGCDMLSKSSFLSGFGKGNGILQNLSVMAKDGSGKTHGILFIKDFSTFLNLPDEDRANIQSQLRSIYDGYLDKQSGNQDKITSWKGKLTVIAACTNALERYWKTGHDLGERFLTSRMREIEGIENLLTMSKKALDINDALVIKGYKKVITDFVGYGELNTAVVIPHELWQKYGLLHIGLLISRLRQSVITDYRGTRKDILDIESPESPTRVIRQLGALTKGRAILYRTDVNNTEEIKEHIMYAKQLGIHTVPKKRMKIVASLFTSKKYTCSFKVLRECSHIPSTSLQRTIDDLEALSVINVEKIGQYNQYTLSESMIDLMHNCQLLKRNFQSKSD